MVSTLPAFFVVMRYALVPIPLAFAHYPMSAVPLITIVCNDSRKCAEVRLLGWVHIFNRSTKACACSAKRTLPTRAAQSVAELGASLVALLITAGSTWMAGRRNGLVTLGLRLSNAP